MENYCKEVNVNTQVIAEANVDTQVIADRSFTSGVGSLNFKDDTERIKGLGRVLGTTQSTAYT